MSGCQLQFNARLGGVRVLDHVVHRLLERQKHIVAHLGQNGGGRQTRRQFGAIAHAGHGKIILRIFAGVIGEAFERVVGRVHRPDDFIERVGGFARGGANLLRVLFNFCGDLLVGLRHLAQQRDLREIGAELVMQIAGDARALVLDQFLLLRHAQLAPQLGGGHQINRPGHQGHKNQNAGRDEPRLAPERRLDDDGDARAGFIPIAVLITGRHMENIVAGGQFAKMRHALAANVGGVLVVVFKLIFKPRAELRALGRGEIQRGEMDFQLLVIGLQDDRPGQRGAQRAAFLRHAIHQHGLDNHRRRIGVRP